MTKLIQGRLQDLEAQLQAISAEVTSTAKFRNFMDVEVNLQPKEDIIFVDANHDERSWAE